MAHSLSAKKRIRQNKVHRARNRARKKDLHVAIRKVNETIGQGDAGKVQETLRAAIRTLDQTAAKGTIHKNTANRKKSRLQRRVNALARKTSG